MAASNGKPVGADDVAMPFVSMVVPCYNEYGNLRELHRRLAAVGCDLMKPFEIVLVNDGSTDGTWPELADLAKHDTRVVGVNLSRNFGQQAALSAGLALARGERVFVLDADLQDPPELLPQFLALMDDGADVVYGRRRSRAGESWFKQISAAAFYRLLQGLSATPMPRDTGEFRLLSRRAVDMVVRMPERHRYVRGLASWIGFQQAVVDYDRAPRTAGATHWTIGKMFALAVDAITAFSARPLRFATWLALAIGGAGILALAHAGVAWLWRGVAEEWLAGVGVMAVLSSAQLLALGVIGEYLARLYEQSQGRPLFVIRDVVRQGEGATSIGAGRDPGTMAPETDVTYAGHR